MKSVNNTETVSNGPRTQLEDTSADLLDTSDGTAPGGSSEGDMKVASGSADVEQTSSGESGTPREKTEDDTADHPAKSRTDQNLRDQKIIEDIPTDAVSRTAEGDKDEENDDVEVSEILQATESKYEADEATEPGEMLTEVIMTKTFTESVNPDKEFVPVRSDYLPDGTEQCWSATVSAAVATPSAKRSDALDGSAVPKATAPGESSATGSTAPIASKSADVEQTPGGESGTPREKTEDDFEGRSAVRVARGQMRDLTSEFRHLQELLDDLSAPTHPVNPGSSSDEDLASEGLEGQPPSARVVYRYRLRARPASAEQQLPRRRWRQRSDDMEQPQDTVAEQSRTDEDLKQQEDCVVETEQHLVQSEGQQQHPTGELTVSSES